MRSVTFGICCAALVTHALPLEVFEWLPREVSDPAVFVALLLVTGYAGLGYRHRYLAVLLGILFGAAWSARAIDSALSQRLPLTEDRVEVLLEGWLDELPRIQKEHVRFQLNVSKVTALDGLPLPALRRVRLNLYLNSEGAVAPAAGESWRVHARLRAPHGFQNPGGFDYEAWLLGQEIDATGYVVGATRSQTRKSLPLWQRVRLSLRKSYLEGHADRWGSLLALVTADTLLMDPTQWQIFRHTGTVHLMVISGLHVGLVAALSFLPGRWLAIAIPGLGKRIPLQRCGVLTSLAGALAYVGLAGFSVPTQRAAVMLSMVLWAQWSGRHVSVCSLFLYALCLVLVLDPLAPLATGFWLSFGAVALLLLGYAPKKRPHPVMGLAHRECSSMARFRIFLAQLQLWCLTLIKVQMLLFVGMLPLMWFSVGSVQWIAPVANLIAVPLVSLLIVPLAILGSVLLPIWPGIGGMTLDLGAWLMAALLTGLTGLAEISETLALHSQLDNLAPLAVIVLVAASVLYLLPGPRWRLLPVMLTLLWLAASNLVASPPQRPVSGEVRITALDVGQGTAVLIDTKRHRLLYDAGNRYPSGFDLGAAVVVPAIRASGPGLLHALVLSHDDRDHIGGAAAVLEALPVSRILRGEFTRPLVVSGPSFAPAWRLPVNWPHRKVVFCGAVQPWVWDQVRFEVLHPRDRTRAGNDSSCVVSIQSQDRHILLSGDISTRVERHLLPQLGKLDVLLVAHHGSNSSSGRAFIAATRPTIALVSSGFGNTFSHPDAKVVKRFQACGTRLFNTARSGALVWQSWNPADVIEWRWHNRVPYWRTGVRLSMKDPGIRQKMNTTATRRNESRKACVMP